MRIRDLWKADGAKERETHGNPRTWIWPGAESTTDTRTALGYGSVRLPWVTVPSGLYPRVPVGAKTGKA